MYYFSADLLGLGWAMATYSALCLSTCNILSAWSWRSCIQVPI